MEVMIVKAKEDVIYEIGFQIMIEDSKGGAESR